ncbi:hypothetical protein QBC37DRAFT_188377 [Rhypophila decipiens]|uniref:WSC domain-containing protein n=1 Tax=Rhypophila decipiens TaxID=261697 RepID=A0AAN6YH65_9PEZI|nr:hypothetical protein QBC37DRAFT_188377 [Rhypophila decipiens]
MAQPPRPRSYAPWALICSISLLSARVAVEAQQGPSIPLAYCASVNTNQGFKPFHSNFQSEGRCKDNCTSAGFPLGVIQQKDCWCSDTAPGPGDQKPLSDCALSCPGYPTDYCGGKGAFAYLLLGELSSTDGDGTAPSTTTSVSTSATSVVEETTNVVVTSETKTVQSTVEVEESHSPPVTSMASQSSTQESSAPTEPLVQTVTVGGTVRTVTATPSSTSTGAPPASLAESNSGGGGLATGAAVGIAVGVVAALAVVGVFLWLWCVKRKRREAEANGGTLGTPSVHGSSGMLGTPKTAEISNPFGASDGSDGGVWDANGKRRSHLMPIDPRLDPFAKGIYAGAQNKSHESIGSLQDNHDYSRRVHQAPRVLRAVNPDPDDD